MGAAGPFLVLLVAEHPPDLFLVPKWLSERRALALAIQAPVRAHLALAPAAPQVDADRLVTVAKRKQVTLQPLRPQEQE